MDKRRVWSLCFLILMATAVHASGAPEARNIGHRVAAGEGEYHEALPENSLIALKTALLGKTYNGHPLQFHPNFSYLEFDVQETADGQLVLFHDRKIDRMFPQNSINGPSIQKILKSGHKSYDQLTIHDLTLEQLQTLVLKNSQGERIATLDNFLQGCLRWGLIRPVTLEIKYFYTDAAREYLLETYSAFKENFLGRVRVIKTKNYDLDPTGVGFLSQKSNLQDSFNFNNAQKKAYWCDRFRNAGFSTIPQIILHWNNLCS
ncbi:MAG: hypothetical protein A2X86_16865 [Bdellovibrionales bacterium GWA2_49_15]|nr:MAG: hypothetical protein A2X86_16865 [Bdellovibrionales bacterium GWA2_49_15]HAZ12453.1 hypothetical protein [Bdellovibrionales bacterium]